MKNKGEFLNRWFDFKVAVASDTAVPVVPPTTPLETSEYSTEKSAESLDLFPSTGSEPK